MIGGHQHKFKKEKKKKTRIGRGHLLLLTSDTRFSNQKSQQNVTMKMRLGYGGQSISLGIEWLL